MIITSRLIATGLRNDVAIQAISGLKVYQRQFPHKLEDFPFIMVTDETIDSEGEDISVQINNLTVTIFTMRNTDDELEAIASAVQNVVNGKSFSDAITGSKLTCRFQRTLEVETGELKMAPKPRAVALRYYVIKVD
jgi:hypothetical protein